MIHGAWTSPRRLAVVFATIAGITVAAFLGVRVFTGPTEYEPYPKFLRRDINGRGIPLTAEQKVRAVEIALGDARVKALVGERRVVEAVAGEWFVHGFLVGAEVRIAFEGPQVIEGEWLILQQSAGVLGAGRQVFPSLAFRQAVAGAGVLVQIDWNRGEVATIQPEGGAADEEGDIEGRGTVPPEIEEELEALEEKYGPVSGE